MRRKEGISPPAIASAYIKTRCHWKSNQIITKTCHVLFLIFQQSPLGSGIGGMGSGEQHYTQGLQEGAHICAPSNPLEGWPYPYKSALWGNIHSCCPSHRNDLCQPSLIASGKINQGNKDLLLKGWLLTQLVLAAVSMEGLRQAAPGLLAGRGRHRVWRRVSSPHCGLDFCLVCFLYAWLLCLLLAGSFLLCWGVQWETAEQWLIASP